MFCSLYKWFISQASDSGKPISGLVKRHVRHCTSCREYARFCYSLKGRFAQNKAELLMGFDREIDKKILSALDKKPVSPPVPARKPIFIPAAAAALVIAVIAISIILLRAPQSDRMAPLNQLASFEVPPSSFESMLTNLEAPMDEELSTLKQTLKSTGEYLISCLDFKIGQNKE